MADSTLHLYGIISLINKVNYFIGCYMNNNIVRICGYCSKEYSPKRLDRSKKFCSSTCSLAINRKSPTIFWENASEEEKLNKLHLFLNKHAIKQDGCWGWNGYLNDGYGTLSMGNLGIIRAHRASWMIHKGDIPKELIVLHNCDNRSCVNPDHLRLGTHKDNADDKYKRGRSNHHHGESHFFSKLDNEKVKQIRCCLGKGISCRELSKKFNVSWHAIYNIRSGKTWRNLK